MVATQDHTLMMDNHTHLVGHLLRESERAQMVEHLTDLQIQLQVGCVGRISVTFRNNLIRTHLINR